MSNSAGPDLATIATWAVIIALVLTAGAMLGRALLGHVC